MKRLREDLSVILLVVEFYHSKVLFSSENITQSYLRNTLAVPSKMYLTPWKLVSLENSDTLGADVICSSNVGATCVMNCRIRAHFSNLKDEYSLLTGLQIVLQWLSVRTSQRGVHLLQSVMCVMVHKMTNGGKMDEFEQFVRKYFLQNWVYWYDCVVLFLAQMNWLLMFTSKYIFSSVWCCCRMWRQ